MVSFKSYFIYTKQPTLCLYFISLLKNTVAIITPAGRNHITTEHEEASCGCKTVFNILWFLKE